MANKKRRRSRSASGRPRWPNEALGLQEALGILSGVLLQFGRTLAWLKARRDPAYRWGAVQASHRSGWTARLRWRAGLGSPPSARLELYAPGGKLVGALRVVLMEGRDLTTGRFYRRPVEMGGWCLQSGPKILRPVLEALHLGLRGGPEPWKVGVRRQVSLPDGSQTRIRWGDWRKK